MAPVLAPARPVAYTGASWLRQYGWIVAVVGGLIVVGGRVVQHGLPIGFGEAKVLTRSGGWVPVEKAATPIRVQPIVVQRGSRAYITVRMTDAQGDVVRAVRVRGGSRPVAPSVSIYDADGSRIYRCKLSYG